MQAGALGRPPPSLAGDDLMTLPVRPRPHHQRLQQTLLADRLRQLVERLVVEAPPRIVGVGRNRLDWQMPQRPDVLDERLLADLIADQRRQSAPEPPLLLLVHCLSSFVLPTKRSQITPPANRVHAGSPLTPA